MRFGQHLNYIVNRLREDAEQGDFGQGFKLTREAVQKLDAEGVRWSKVLENAGHFDAGESAILSRQLLYIKQREANILYPNLKARQFIPVSNEIPSGATQFSIKIWDIKGMAKIVSDYANDFPSVNVNVQEVLAPIRSIGDSYSYTLQELRASSMVPGLSLDTRRATAARMLHERKIETIAAAGDTVSGLGGMAKNTNVPLASVTGTWSSASAAVILADLNAIAQTVITQSKQIHQPDTLLLGTAAYGIINTKPYSDLNPDTILQVFLRNSPYINDVDQWVQLDLLNASNNGPRAVCYARDPMNLTLEIPQEFEQLPPQLEGMEYTVPCHSRIGGVSITYPLSMVYADGL
jgi:hypothetical protein